MSQEPVSGYRVAIEETEQALGRRARVFRRQVVAVVSMIAATILASTILGLSMLAGSIVLIPMCGLFMIADDRILNRWRQRLLSRWMARGIDFEAFRLAMGAIPRLPERTIDGMLDTLPAAGDLTFEQTLQPSTRQAIAAACMTSHGAQSDALLLKVFAAAIAAAALLAAVWTGSWRPLAGAIALVLLPFVAMWLRRRRQATREAIVATCRLQPDFDEAGYERVCARLD